MGMNGRLRSRRILPFLLHNVTDHKRREDVWRWLATWGLWLWKLWVLILAMDSPASGNDENPPRTDVEGLRAFPRVSSGGWGPENLNIL